LELRKRSDTEKNQGEGVERRGLIIRLGKGECCSCKYCCLLYGGQTRIVGQ